MLLMLGFQLQESTGAITCTIDILLKVFADLRTWCEERKLHLIDCDLRWVRIVQLQQLLSSDLLAKIVIYMYFHISRPYVVYLVTGKGLCIDLNRIAQVYKNTMFTRLLEFHAKKVNNTL